MFKDDSFFVNDGAHQDTGVTALNNTWYHIKVTFECGAGGYDDLEADEWNLYINGEIFGEYDFHTPRDTLSRTVFQSSGGSSGYKTYYDGIGYSWDGNYNIGDNMIPFYILDNSSYKIDKFEFVFEGLDDLFEPTIDTSYNGWDETESGDGKVQIQAILDWNHNREIGLLAGTNTGTQKIVKDDFTSTAERIDITFGIQFQYMTDVGGYSEIRISSSTPSEIIQILRP